MGASGPKCESYQDTCAHPCVCIVIWSAVAVSSFRAYNKPRMMYTASVTFSLYIHLTLVAFYSNCWHLRDSSWTRSGGYHSTITLFIQHSPPPPPPLSLPTSQHQIRTNQALILHLRAERLSESCWSYTMRSPITTEGPSPAAFLATHVWSKVVWGWWKDWISFLPLFQKTDLHHLGLR